MVEEVVDVVWYVVWQVDMVQCVVLECMYVFGVGWSDGGDDLVDVWVLLVKGIDQWCGGIDFVY